MKKFKINGKVIEAKSIADAIHQAKDADYITVKTRMGEYKSKVSDYCVVKFPFAAYAKDKDSNDRTLYPCKIEGWYKNGRTYSGTLICKISEIYNGSSVWYGKCLSTKFTEKNYGDSDIAVRPKEIRDVSKYYRPITKEELIAHYKKEGYEVIDSIDDSVKDSDLLKQMAYKLADMASYFDRANSPYARNQFVQKEYEKKLNETYTYGLKVYEQLKKEINAMNSSNSIGKGGWKNTETVDLLKDAGHNIYWAAADVYPRKPHIEAFGKKLENLANEYQQKLDELHSEYRRNQRNDSEEVEDLATVDKTFLLNLTRKIISNITSDNFTTAQTQAKELERYINNLGYADSVDDSVKDGRTYTNCVLWLKRALDDVQGYHSVDAISKLNKVIFWLKNDPNFVDSVEDSYNWKQLIEKHKFNLTYQYETGGFKVPLKLSKNNAKYDIEENFNIKNYTEQDVREYQRAWEEFARKYRGKDSVDDSIKDRDITKAEESEIARELTRRFNIKFTTTGESAVEASIGIWANSELDKKIVKYLKSKGYKVEWDSIGDDGYYYLMK